MSHWFKKGQKLWVYLFVSIYIDDSDYYDGSGSGDGSEYESGYKHSETILHNDTIYDYVKNSELNHKNTNDTKKTEYFNNKTEGNQMQKSINTAKVESESIKTMSKEDNMKSQQSDCKNDVHNEELEKAIKEKDKLQGQLSVILLENDLLKQNLKKRIDDYKVLEDKVKCLKKYIYDVFP